MLLHDLELSGNCYKVRLFAALAGIPLPLAPVDFLGGEHRRPPLLALNPWGELPVLQDGDLLLMMGAGDIGHMSQHIAAHGFSGKASA